MCYSMDCAIKSFAVSNEWSATLNKICFKLGKQLRPFSLLSDEFQEKYGVLDLAKCGGLLDQTIPMIDEVAKVRNEEYHIVKKSELDDRDKRLLFIHYLLATSICYCEVEKWKTTNGVASKTYDKFLCTRNPAIMGAWMGMSPAEMQAKYSRRIQVDNADLNEGVLRYVKLQSSAKGNSITVPRNFASFENMRCVPLFMLYAWVTGAKEVMKNNIVKFTFLKDNHTERELCTTLSEDIVRKYYTDNLFISTMLSGVDIDSNQQGGMNLSSKIHRGYIKLPELGSSIYDSSGTRSLNLARILKAEVVDDIDTTFINVSLSSVVANFKNHIDSLVVKMPTALSELYNKLTATETYTGGESSASIVESLYKYVDDNEMILSTSFQRQLHLFMVENPQWFTTYTGQPVKGVSTSTENFGVAQFDF